MFRIDFKKMLRRRRKGVSVVESMILMVVLGISIWAIMSTVLWASEMQSFSRQDIGARIVAASWFETADSIPPVSFDSDFSDAIKIVLKQLGGKNDVLWGFSIKPVLISTLNGAREIRLTIETSGKNAPFVITRSLNQISVETVSDDRA